jgi:glutathione S-transferase
MPKLSPFLLKGDSEGLQKAVEEFVVPWLALIDKKLPTDKKFLFGDNITIYDISIAGFFMNMICNKNSPDKAFWETIYAKATPRV